MAIETCVFCGEKHSTFRSTTIACGNTWQKACKAFINCIIDKYIEKKIKRQV